MAKIKGFSWIMHPPGGKENKEMKVMKRVLASSLCAALILSGAPSAMLGSTGLALFEGLGVAPQKAYAKVVDNSWYTRSSDGSKIYANGVPVIIDEDADGNTMMYHDDNADGVLDEGETTFAATLSNAPSVYAGSDTGNTEDAAEPAASGQITMLGGRVNTLIGSNDGPGVMETSSISVENGTVAAISMHETDKPNSVTNGRTFENRKEFAVKDAVINISGGTVTNYVRATYNYAYVENATINISEDAHIIKDGNGDSIYAGSNGEVGTMTINIDGGIIDGRISSGLRALVGDYNLNFTSGTVKEGIFAGASYPDGETATTSNNWNGWSWGYVNYGVTTGNTRIYIGPDANYRGIYAGFQFFPQDVYQFMSKYNSEGSSPDSTNLASIKAAYEMQSIADGERIGTVELDICAEPSGKPNTSNIYQYTTSLLDKELNGVTVTSAPTSLEVTPKDVKLNLEPASGSNAPKNTAELTAEVEFMASVASATASDAPRIEWTVEGSDVVTVEPSEDGTAATVTAVGVGAADVTATYAYTDAEDGTEISVSDYATVIVGGDLNITVSPAEAKLGDTIKFGVTRIPATASDAPYYDWQIDGDVAEFKESDNSSSRNVEAVATAVGTGIVGLTFDDEGNISEGFNTFKVTAPEIELTNVKATYRIGDRVTVGHRITNVNSSYDKELLDVTYEEDPAYLAADGDGFIVYAMPERSEQRKTEIKAKLIYHTADGTGEAVASKEIMIKDPVAVRKTFLLDPSKSETVIDFSNDDTLTYFINNDYAELMISDEAGLIEVDTEEIYDGKLTVSMAEDAAESGNAHVMIVLSNSDRVIRLADYSINVETAESSVLEGGVSAKVTVEPVAPKAPEGVDQAVVDELTNQAFEALAESVTTVYDDEDALQNLGNAVANQGLIAEGETASVSIGQELTDIQFETIVETDEDGNQTVSVVPRSITYEIDAYKRVIDENGVYGEAEKLDLGRDSIKKRTYFSFWIPVPKTVSEIYVNLKQDGEALGQYTIKETETGDRYIDVRVWHLSTFELTFTNERQSSGSSGGGSVTGAGVYYADGRSAVAAGTWTQDANGWKYVLANGSYPVNAWYECEWNGQKLWYHFGAEGYADSGWFTDTDGNTYYLHPDHDGNFGYMYTGWNLIGGKNYFFSTGTWDGLPKGALFKGTTTPDGHRVGADGAWDGVN